LCLSKPPPLIVNLEQKSILKEVVFMLQSSGIYDEMNRIKKRVFPKITKIAGEENQRAFYINKLKSQQLADLESLMNQDFNIYANDRI